MKLLYHIKRWKRLLNPSPAEKAFIHIWKDMGLYWKIRYRYKREYIVGGYHVDFGLPKQKIAIEIDGAQWHDTIADWERDKNLYRMGWLTLRISARDVLYNPAKVKHTLKYFLTHGKYPKK